MACGARSAAAEPEAPAPAAAPERCELEAVLTLARPGAARALEVTLDDGRPGRRLTGIHRYDPDGDEASRVAGLGARYGLRNGDVVLAARSVEAGCAWDVFRRGEEVEVTFALNQDAPPVRRPTPPAGALVEIAGIFPMRRLGFLVADMAGLPFVDTCDAAGAEVQVLLGPASHAEVAAEVAASMRPHGCDLVVSDTAVTLVSYP